MTPQGRSECFICGDTNQNALHEHHIVPREYNGTDAPENTTMLCASCHQAIHKLYDDAFFDRLEDKLNLQLEGADRRPVDIDGAVVEPEKAANRGFPDNSPHAHKEPFTFKLQFEKLDSVIEDLGDAPEHDPRQDYAAYISDALAAQSEEIKSHFNDGDCEHEPFVILADNPRLEPRIRISTSGNRGFQKPARLHCSYCRTVFSSNEEAGMASHLRVRHGVEDPYERPEMMKRDGPLSIKQPKYPQDRCREAERPAMSDSNHLQSDHDE
jgi:hypothetical protein